MEAGNLHIKSVASQSESKAPFRGFGGRNPYKSGGMFEGASSVIFENAKHLRKKMTDAEQVLWYYLKAGINGLKFRRQHPIGIYIADFYCHKAKLIIEVDGSIHNRPEIMESDKIRQRDLEDWGYRITRFTNQQVIINAKEVMASIEETVTEIINIENLNAPSNDGV